MSMSEETPLTTRCPAGVLPPTGRQPEGVSPVVTVAQSTTRTVVAKSGMVLPATITPQTDFNLMETACAVYHRFNGCKVAYDTIEKVKDAMRDSGAIVALYCDAKGDVEARVIWPEAVTLTKDNAITTRAYCTLRKEWRSFRLDRIVSCHPLTTPDDVIEEEPQEPHQDWEDSPQARGR